MAESTRRVKVYQLNDLGQWDDKGTGQISFEEQSGAHRLIVRSEENTNEDLLQHAIERDIEYHRQGPTIVTWNEPSGIDLALSFQEVHRCTDIWEKIQEAQNLRSHAIQEQQESALPPEVRPDSAPATYSAAFESESKQKTGSFDGGGSGGEKGNVCEGREQGRVKG
jgi:hypothetical protein